MCIESRGLDLKVEGAAQAFHTMHRDLELSTVYAASPIVGVEYSASIFFFRWRTAVTHRHAYGANSLPGWGSKLCGRSATKTKHKLSSRSSSSLLQVCTCGGGAVALE